MTLKVNHFFGGLRGHGIRSAALIILFPVLSKSSRDLYSLVPYMPLVVVKDLAFEALIYSSKAEIFSVFVAASFFALKKIG